MLYYLSLNEREFPLRVPRGTPGERRLVQGVKELDVEVLSHSEHGRPTLVLVDGAVYRVRAAARPSGTPVGEAGAGRRVIINGQPLELRLESELARRARPNRNKTAVAIRKVVAPMPGRVVKVNVRVGDTVAAGAPLLGIEAMKMENELVAPSAGTITKLSVTVGATVDADQELIVIEPA
jgi:biotin carboxyl carrier protein